MRIQWAPGTGTGTNALFLQPVDHRACLAQTGGERLREGYAFGEPVAVDLDVTDEAGASVRLCGGG